MTFAELANVVGGEAPAVVADGNLGRVAAIDDASADAIVFTQDEKGLAAALASKAGAILARLDAESDDVRVLRVRDPRLAFAKAARTLQGNKGEGTIHPSASIDVTATIGTGTSVGAFAVVEAGAVIGQDCLIAARATIAHGVELGDRVVVQSGAVLGAVGFGYARDGATGEYLLFPQQGRLVIEDDVEIGANTTVDRGALGETRIGRGTKIDNLVHIAHNCVIGKNVVIAAQVGIAGSSVVGDGVMLGGQAGLGDHVRIGDGVILGGQGGVYPGATLEGSGEVFTGTPAQPVREHLRGLAKLRRLK